MERSQVLDAMSQLKLYGMKAAYDEVIATAVKRQHEPQQIVGDLLNAEINEKQARSIKYQMTIAKLPLAKEVDEFSFEGRSSRGHPQYQWRTRSRPRACSALMVGEGQLLQSAPITLIIRLEKPGHFRTENGLIDHLGWHESVTHPDQGSISRSSSALSVAVARLVTSSLR